MRALRPFAVAGLLALACAATLTLDPWQDDHITDVPIYESYAVRVLDGDLPYRDFAIEYPPLAAPLFVLPELFVEGYPDYRIAFGVAMFLLLLALCWATAGLARATGGSPWRAALAVAALPLLLGAIVRARYDVAPTVAAALALVLVLRGRAAGGLALAGAGALLKVFPALVATAALPWLWGRGQRREARRAALALGAVLLVGFGVWFGISPGGAWDSIDYHLERPVQVESSPAAAVYVASALGAEQPAIILSHGANGVAHPAADALGTIFAAAGLLVIAAFALLASRRPGTRALALAALGQIAALATFGKVLSPQFLVWIAPLLALALAWRMWPLAGCLGIATVLTLAGFPGLYVDLIARDSLATALLIARDELLLAAVALTLLALWREPRTLSSPAPLPG